jgi:hypothetical protein
VGCRGRLPLENLHTLRFNLHKQVEHAVPWKEQATKGSGMQATAAKSGVTLKARPAGRAVLPLDVGLCCAYNFVVNSAFP